MSSRSRPLTPRRLGLALGLAICLAGCGISTDEDARAVPDLDQNLFDVATTSTTEEVVETPRYELQLYFVNDDNTLVEVVRPRETRASIQETLELLTAPPSEAELADNPGVQGIVDTRLPGGLEPQAGVVSELGVLPVHVSNEIGLAVSENPDRVREIYSQIICTVVALEPRILGVQISDDTGPILVSIEGEVIERPVTTADVDDCRTGLQKANEVAEAVNEGEGEDEGEGEGG